MSLEKVEHDVKSAISALTSAIELVGDEWNNNTEIVDKILPLMSDKIIELQNHLAKYKTEKK
jgi:hypothetical protein